MWMRSYSHRISEWYSLVAAPPLELTPYDCSEFFYFEPKMKSNCTLYSLNMASPGKFGTISKAAMKNVVELFASHVFDALKEKGRCSWRVKARFGKVLHPVYCKPQFTECNISDIEDDKGFLVDQVPKKFTTEVCGGNSKSFGHSTLNALIPQIDKQREFMEELGRVTVLLIKAVFFNTNGCECEYAILKCIKEEGRGVYQLVEVRKEPKEVTCDCLFLQYCHDIRVAMSVEKEDMRFSDSLRSKAEEIIQAIREQENGSFSMVTRTENFAVLQVRRSEKVHYKFKHIQQWYFLTSTVDEQCHVHLNEMTVPKDGSTVNIIFEEKKYKELELFNPQWISNYSLLEKVTVEKAFEKHFFHLRDIEKRMFPPQEPTVDAFREELESFMKCARHIASYHST